MASCPRFDRPSQQMVYQPMLEVMNYLRDNGYRTHIVTGGGQEFWITHASDWTIEIATSRFTWMYGQITGDVKQYFTWTITELIMH